MLKRERQAMRAALKIQRAGKTSDERLAAALSELLNMGGLYVKFAQLLLLNQSFSKTTPAELRRAIFDRVRLPANPSKHSFFSPTELLNLERRGVKMLDQPSYAGSFAVVFEGSYEGRPVIIKVIRPELRRQLKQDLRLIAIISKSIGIFKSDVQLALRNAYQTFSTSVMNETDYKKEIANAQKLYEIYQDDPVIVIPKTYPDLSAEHFIVQDKITGVWLSEILQLNLKAEAASDYVSQQVGSQLTYQLYYLGFKSLSDSLAGNLVHGDPHPGNVVLMPHNQVGLIDFGVSAEPVRNRLALLEYIKEQIRGRDGDIDVPRLMISIVRFHASHLYKAIESLANYYKKPIFNDLYKFLEQEVKTSNEIDKSMVPEGQYSNMLSSSINKNNRFGLVPKVDEPITQKAFITLWRTYDELGYMDITFQVFRDVVAKTEMTQDVGLWKEPPMPPAKAVEIVNEWLNMVAEKDPQLFTCLRKIMHG